MGDVGVGVVHRWGGELPVRALSLTFLGADQGISEVAPGFLQCFDDGFEAFADPFHYGFHGSRVTGSHDFSGMGKTPHVVCGA